jgi:hypothetical protein
VNKRVEGGEQWLCCSRDLKAQGDVTSGMLRAQTSPSWQRRRTDKQRTPPRTRTSSKVSLMWGQIRVRSMAVNCAAPPVRPPSTATYRGSLKNSARPWGRDTLLGSSAATRASTAGGERTRGLACCLCLTNGSPSQWEAGTNHIADCRAAVQCLSNIVSRPLVHPPGQPQRRRSP